MGDLQRSAKMSYLQVLVPNDTSEDFAHQLGKTGCLMVSDLNSEMPNIDRPYMVDIIRLQEIEKTVDEIELILSEKGVSMQDEDGVSIASVSEYDLKNIPRRNENVETVESAVYEDHRDLMQQIAVLDSLEEQFNGNKNAVEVLEANAVFLSSGVQEDAKDSFAEQSQGSYQADDLEGGRGNATVKEMGFKYISGIVGAHHRFAFQRQMFLITRGNCFGIFRDIEDDETAFTFMVLYLGDRFHTQLRRLCKFMDISIYITSEDSSEQTLEKRIQKLNAENERLATVLGQTRRNLDVKMRVVAHKLKLWKITLIQEKAIKVVLNKFEVREQALVCQGWCPTHFIERVEEAMEAANFGKGGVQGIVNEIAPPKGDIPPTFFQTNKFTKAFQAIINTYGVPRYREYNPTVPTIITLPFLFAMMFGDMFHGAVVFFIALWLVLNESNYEGKKLNEMLWWLYGGRYIILLMGFFSVYNGIVYNDILSLATQAFGSSAWTQNDTSLVGEFDGVYAFGIDPTWHGKSNQITEYNSIKMKMSVLYGVTQMSFGLFLCMLNHVEFQDWITLIFEWIPQVMFMLSFFVYMCFIIIYKWCINWDDVDFEPPSLITVLVDFVLDAGTVTKDETQLYSNITLQENLQFGLFIMMFLSIPIMLLAKPCVLKCKHGRKARTEYNTLEDAGVVNEHGVTGDTTDHKEVADSDGGDVESAAVEHGHGHGEEFDFGEIMIHQMIHTIEYVLGTVSNTASYLRLWALSLAHAELSEVFYQKTLLEMMTSSGYMLFIGCTVFYAMTFGVLIVMDQLECFLHALRLHWVEFQNKFYYADGVEFEPFSYSSLVENR